MGHTTALGVAALISKKMLPRSLPYQMAQQLRRSPNIAALGDALPHMIATEGTIAPTIALYEAVTQLGAHADVLASRSLPGRWVSALRQRLGMSQGAPADQAKG